MKKITTIALIICISLLSCKSIPLEPTKGSSTGSEMVEHFVLDLYNKKIPAEKVANTYIQPMQKRVVDSAYKTPEGYNITRKVKTVKRVIGYSTTGSISNGGYRLNRPVSSLNHLNVPESVKNEIRFRQAGPPNYSVLSRPKLSRKEKLIKIISDVRKGELPWHSPLNYIDRSAIKKLEYPKVYTYNDYEHLCKILVRMGDRGKKNMFVLLDEKKENILLYFWLTDRHDKIRAFTMWDDMFLSH